MKKNNARKYECPIPKCGKSYGKPSLLREHVRSHNNERPYACPEPNCTKSFLRICHLNVHKWSHSSIKPLTCHHCFKGFTTKQQLSRHEKTHTKDRILSHELSTSDKIEPLHIRTSSDTGGSETPFNCAYENCNDSFTSGWMLMDHLLEKHLTSVIDPEFADSEPLWLSSTTKPEISSEELEAHLKRYEIALSKDRKEEAELWDMLRCRHHECSGWSASSSSALIAHYEERHDIVPVSLLQYGFQDSYWFPKE
ncbi:Fzf1p LALA0_S12e00320g [Lachancea lanzarotensis]|uniref:LALA0S12e00320g1_1 n=1 Tax=Lachancea lanzarotensis TaxID=1245769 RepID=A0A0C7NFM9_9SACH|nr:uncharacterized protein LALA0_S12e00320g [Lachancea lanzarotensis]CEP64505.1 LALA0S12e00320g1_1 [Lachancea lanzarotensis]